MPDPTVILMAMIVSLTISAALAIVTAWFSRLGGTGWNKTGSVLGVGIGFFVGCWVLGIHPRWPPREDLERLLVVVLPAVVGIELLSLETRVPGWLVWSLRLTLLAAAARVLLHGTSYITDFTEPGTREWSPLLTWVIFGSLATVEGVVWALLSLLARRVSNSAITICLAIACAGAAVTVMLSGYATGGQIGFPLAAALSGTTAIALLSGEPAQRYVPLGVPLVGLFSLLLIGRFFGALSSVHAIVLSCAPLLSWLPELPVLRRLPSRVRDLGRIVLVGAIVFFVIVRAQAKFNDDFRSSWFRVRTELAYPSQLAPESELQSSAPQFLTKFATLLQ